MTYEELRAKVDELRAIPLKEIEISDEELTKRRNDRMRAVVFVCFMMSLITALSTGFNVYLLRGDKSVYDMIVGPSVYLLLAVFWFMYLNKMYRRPQADLVIVDAKHLIVKNEIGESKVHYKRVSGVSTCTEGLWVEHGWSCTILEHKYFESYTDMLKFKDMLLEVVRESRRK